MFNKYRLTAAMYIGINSDVSVCIDKMLLLMLLADICYENNYCIEIGKPVFCLIFVKRNERR